MKKITDIKKISKQKHINVADQTKEAHIDVKEEKKHDAAKSKQSERGDTKEQHVERNVDDMRSTKKIRIVFMGTGEFAGNILKKIYADKNCSMKQIVTQPDKKVGRKKSSIYRTLAPNPVRKLAQENNTALFQPSTLDEHAIKEIKKNRPDIIIVASYGKILPRELLKIPRYDSLNIHASLLPQLRGASPVQNALLIGLKETGITIIKMDDGMDTGDIVAQKKVTIQEHEKADELLARLSLVGVELFLEILPRWIDGKISTKHQDNEHATICQLIDREDGHIQWTQTTQEIYNRYRSLYPWPGVFSYWEETENQLIRIKLRATYPYTEDLTQEQKKMIPGTVFIGADQLCIRTFDSAIIVEAIQPECKTVMPVYDFLNGHEKFEGAILR